MRREDLQALALLAFLAVSITLTLPSRSEDICLGQGTFNSGSEVALKTPEGTFTIDFKFNITIEKVDSTYNITVIGEITNVSGPPALLQSKTPLLDFAVITDEGEFRWSDDKVFPAVMIPITDGVTSKMSLQNIKSSCITSVIIDAPGLGLHNIINIGVGMPQGYEGNRLSQPSVSQSTGTVTYTVESSYQGGTPAYSGASYAASLGSVGNEERLERYAIAAVIALIAAVGVGLLLYSLFT
jgi:hypothetical protein